MGGEAGVKPETLRRWAKSGVIPQIDESAAIYRDVRTDAVRETVEQLDHLELEDVGR